MTTSRRAESSIAANCWVPSASPGRSRWEGRRWRSQRGGGADFVGCAGFAECGGRAEAVRARRAVGARPFCRHGRGPLDLPPAGGALPRADRRSRPGRSGGSRYECDRGDQPAGDGDRRRARPGACGGEAARTFARHPDRHQGQYRHRRPDEDHRRVAGARRIGGGEGRLSRRTVARRGGGHPRQDQPLRMGELPFDAFDVGLERTGRPGAQSLRPRSQSLRLVEWHRLRESPATWRLPASAPRPTARFSVRRRCADSSASSPPSASFRGGASFRSPRPRTPPVRCAARSPTRRSCSPPSPAPISSIRRPRLRPAERRTTPVLSTPTGLPARVWAWCGSSSAGIRRSIARCSRCSSFSASSAPCWWIRSRSRMSRITTTVNTRSCCTSSNTD